MPRDEQSPNAWRPNPKKAAGSTVPRRRESTPVTGEGTWAERILFGRVSSGQLATFCRQFGSYMEAGVDLRKALTNLQTQFAGKALGPILGRVMASLRRGDGLAEAMAREPSAFDSLFVAMMRAAEARGGAPETLRRLANHYEARRRMLRQAQTAMIYPIAVLTIAGGVCILLVYFVLPFLVDLLLDMTRGKGMDLPLPTRLLIGMTRFAQKFGWWAAPLAAVGGVVGLRVAYKTPGGKVAIDEACLHVPVLGALLRKIDTARFARTLGALLEGGVDVGTSLDLTTDVLRLAPFRRALRGARTLVKEGTELGSALESSGRFPPDVIHAVETGEQTGQLPEGLDRVADDYEEQVSHMVRNLGSLIQPILTIALGGFILFIAVAFMMAYVSVISSLAG